MASYTTIRHTLRVDGVLTDPTSIKLSDATAAYGVRRTDTLAVVVADDTAMTKASTGVYYHTFADPADGLTYQYWLEIVYGGETYRFENSISGGTDTSQNLYDLIPQIAPYVGGVTDPVLKQKLRYAAREFCRKSEIWVEDLASIASVANQADYALATAYDARILRVKYVEVNGVEWDIEKVSTDGATLTLTPAPSTTSWDIDVKVVLLPLETCSAFPAWVLERCGDGIVEGAKHYLKSMEDVPWSDPSGAALAYRQYMRAIGDAKREVMTARGPGILRVTPRAFV